MTRVKTALVSVAVSAAGAMLFAAGEPATFGNTLPNWLNHPAIGYETKPATDPVARLNRSIQDGRTHLAFSGASGYLRATLDALSIPIESQVALFNPDSLQAQIINSTNPRVLFFNDAVSVGWVRGGFIEVASQDPQQGIVFYVLDKQAVDKPRFTRRHDCLGCHYSYSTAGIPGMVDVSFGQVRVDHSSPVDRRWGGFYVTGQPGAAQHQGNRVRGAAPAAPSSSPTWASLDVKFDTGDYLSNHSDIVALLAFDHQMRGMNLLGRMSWEARVVEFDKARENGPAFTLPSGIIADAPLPLADAARELVDYFLFVDEAPLPAPIRGSAGFAERFEKTGPFDRSGRSLRQLDLHTRLLRYPCSYLIYTETFDALTSDAKAAIYRRMWDVLSGSDRDPKYRRLSAADRRAIVEILRDTKSDLPEFFRPI